MNGMKVFNIRVYNSIPRKITIFVRWPCDKAEAYPVTLISCAHCFEIPNFVRPPFEIALFVFPPHENHHFVCLALELVLFL